MIVLLALAVVVATVAVVTHGDSKRDASSRSTAAGGRSTSGAPSGLTVERPAGTSSTADAHPAVTVGSPAGQGATVAATHAVAAAAKSPAPLPVPATFEPDLAQLYQSMYTAAQVIPGLARFAKTESPAQFSAALSRLTARDAGELYAAVRTQSELPALTATVNSFIPAGRAAMRELRLASQRHRTTSTPAAGSHTSAAQATTPSAPQDLTNIPDSLPQTGSFGGGVQGTAYIPNCPSYWSTSIDPYADNAIYALQIVIDVASAVYNAASSFDDAFPVSAISAALTLVAQEVQNDGLYLKGDYEGCEANNIQYAGLDIDNTTYQTYELLAGVAGTANEADTNLVALINQNAADYEFQLQGVIEQALSQPTGTAAMASLELPATAGGYLDSTPVGVQSVVTTELANLEGAGQLTSPQAERDLGLAGQAYSAGEYKSAFQYYQLAYQAAAQ